MVGSGVEEGSACLLDREKQKPFPGNTDATVESGRQVLFVADGKGRESPPTSIVMCRTPHSASSVVPLIATDLCCRKSKVLDFDRLELLHGETERGDRDSQRKDQRTLLPRLLMTWLPLVPNSL